VDGFHLDALDLYLARQRHGFLDAAASELHTSREVLVLRWRSPRVAERARDEGALDHLPSY